MRPALISAPGADANDDRKQRECCNFLLTAASKTAKTGVTMKLKDVFLGICIAALLVSEIFLFTANQKKDTALAQLNAARQQVAQLQQQLDAAKTASATVENSENERLRKENAKLSQNVSQLQKTVKDLRAQNDKLTQQLGTARTAVQLQQAHLEQLRTENQAAATADQEGDLPPGTSQINICINNLRQIDAAKQQWALENNKTDDSIPTASDLLPYLRDNVFPVCPAGGSYIIGAVIVNPACSIPGHVLP